MLRSTVVGSFVPFGQFMCVKIRLHYNFQRNTYLSYWCNTMRLDLVFSYWIFAWYLLYKARLLTYNPKFILGVGIIENSILLLFMIRFGSNIRTIFWFVFINTCIKVLPLYTLFDERIRARDIWFSGFVFSMYAFWIYLNQQSLVGNYKFVVDSLINNRDETPFLKFMKKFRL